MPIVTAFYAALLAILGFVLSIRVIRLRRGKRVSLGDGGDPVLERASRAFGNFAEYAPLFIILLALAEVLGTSRPWLHLFGALFVLARIAHAVGLSFTHGASPGRFVGMTATQAVLIGLAVSLLIVSVPKIF